MYMKNTKGNSENRMGREIGEDTDFKKWPANIIHYLSRIICA